MAIKADYYKYNGATWELFHFRTSADLIHETTNKKVLTSEERTKISDFLTTFNTANKLVKVESGGKIPIGIMPDISNTYLTKNNPAFTGFLKGNLGYFERIEAINAPNRSLEIGSITGDQDSTYISFREPDTGGEMYVYAYNGITLATSNGIIDADYSNIKNLKAPIDPTDATTKEYVDNKVSSGFVTKESVKSASTANVDITAVLNALDGFTLSANDRVLLKNQTTASQNGVYKLDSSKKPVKVASDSAVGSAVFVENGDTNNDYIYHCSTANTWVAFTKPDTIKAGNGLTKSGTTLNVANAGITNTMLAGDINVEKIKIFTSSDSKTAWNNIPTITGVYALKSHLSNLFSAIKLLRGTTNYNTNNTQTIAGAYTAISTVQNNIDTVAGTIPKITSGTSNPSTTGAKNGDLYFKEIS